MGFFSWPQMVVNDLLELGGELLSLATAGIWPHGYEVLDRIWKYGTHVVQFPPQSWAYILLDWLTSGNWAPTAEEVLVGHGPQGFLGFGLEALG